MTSGNTTTEMDGNRTAKPTVKNPSIVENGLVKDYKEKWSPSEIKELEKSVRPEVEIAIVDSLKGFGEFSRKEQEAAEHFLEVQAGDLHPTHEHILNKVSSGSR